MREAWQATLGFTFQIYFDFSGYTDMALGLALMFGIVLPQNFDVPYRSASLRDFWRRWHMTLSRFLRDYLYIPLGGSKRGLPVQVWALFATMALGGLWHGAGPHLRRLGRRAWARPRRRRALAPRRAGDAGAARVGADLRSSWRWLGAVPRADLRCGAHRSTRALFGFAPLGGGFKWRAIAFAAAVAIARPDRLGLRAQACRRGARIAVAFAVLFVLVLFKIGDDANYEFIYFQF